MVFIWQTDVILHPCLPPTMIISLHYLLPKLDFCIWGNSRTNFSFPFSFSDMSSFLLLFTYTLLLSSTPAIAAFLFQLGLCIMIVPVKTVYLSVSQWIMWLIGSVLFLQPPTGFMSYCPILIVIWRKRKTFFFNEKHPCGSQFVLENYSVRQTLWNWRRRGDCFWKSSVSSIVHYAVLGQDLK